MPRRVSLANVLNDSIPKQRKVVPKDAVLIPRDAERVFQGLIFDVYHWPQVLYDGSSVTFEMLKRADTVSAIGVLGDEILLLHDEQPIGGKRLGFPGGRVNKFEDVASAVVREVNEETGYEFLNWRLVKVFQPYSKIEWFIYHYLAWNVSEINAPRLDPGEKAKSMRVPFDKLKRMVLTDKDYLGEAKDLFNQASSAKDLLQLPEFTGIFINTP